MTANKDFYRRLREQLARSQERIDGDPLKGPTKETRSTFCHNCWQRLSETSRVTWLKLVAYGDPDDPDVEEVPYCSDCVKLDGTKTFTGSPRGPVPGVDL